MITNIAAGTRAHTRVVMDSGAIPPLLRLLGSPADDVREQAAWALGNIAGDSPATRDAVLGAGALAPLLALLSGHANTKPAMLRTFTWTLANFCRGIPQPAFELVKSALPELAALIHSLHSQAGSPAAVTPAAPQSLALALVIKFWRPRTPSTKSCRRIIDHA